MNIFICANRTNYKKIIYVLNNNISNLVISYDYIDLWLH